MRYDSSLFRDIFFRVLIKSTTSDTKHDNIASIGSAVTSVPNGVFFKIIITKAVNSNTPTFLISIPNKSAQDFLSTHEIPLLSKALRGL